MNHNLLQRRALRVALFVLLLSVVGTVKTHAQNSVFSVSENTKVIFSPGNLQYQASTNTWRFALNPWDYVGQDNAYISETNVDWIDLFGWGTSGYNHGAVCYQPWSSNRITWEYYYAYGSYNFNLFDQTGQADWGYNAISNGGNQENGGWRTPTIGEWYYLFQTRSTDSGIRYAKAAVNGVNGVILLPDNWSADYYALNNANTSDVSYGSNTITTEGWVILEQHGAVFLPAAGYRKGTSVYNAGSDGDYWSASYQNECYVGCMSFGDYQVATNSQGRREGLSVRLVRASQSYSFGINAIPSSAEGGAVNGAGAYQEGAECTLTATPSTGYDFACWTENGWVASTKTAYSFLVVSDRNLVANFVTAGNITFSDANVKSLCVAKWDANGDGELSYAEAAGVTSLGSLFNNNTTITSFNELQFFIGLGGISANAFDGCTSLSSIGIPSSVKAIGNNAFSGCNALTSVYYSGDVAGWCGIQFNNKYSNPLAYASLLYINNELLRNLVIPNTVTSIGDYAFYNYRTLLSLQLPNMLESIGDDAFYQCSGINSELTFPNTLTYLGNDAFWGCSGLTGSLTLPNALTSIGNYAFDGCIGLTGCLTLPNTLTCIGSSAFYNCSGLTGDLTLPNALTSIGDYAFYNCRGLTGSLTLPNTITSIGSNAFRYCIALTSITIGTGVSQIGNQAFNSCSNLKEVNYNATSCTSSYLFRYCNKLETLTIGENVLTLGDNAFTYCTNLQSIRCLGSNPPIITSTVFNNSILESVEVYVPCEAKVNYQADPIWGNFTNYQDSAYELLVEPEDEAQGYVSIEQYGNCEDPTSTVKADPKLHYGFNAWLKNGEVVSTDRIYTFDLDENMTLVARFEPNENITTHWVPSVDQYEDYMMVTGIVQIDGVEQATTTLELAAFCGDECRGTALASYFPPTDRYVYQLAVYGVSGNTFTFKLFDHEQQEELQLVSPEAVSYQENGYGRLADPYVLNFISWVTVDATVTPAQAGTVEGTGEYIPGETATLTATTNEGYAFRCWKLNGETVSEDNPYSFTVGEACTLTACFDMVQTTAMNNGWNWFSTYIEQNGIDGLGMLENSLGENGEFIKSRSGQVVENYDGSYWWGTLNAIDNEQMFEVKTTAACEAVIQGDNANPSQHPITVKPGWNWIGYVNSGSMGVEDAFSSLTPEEDDAIKARQGYASYFPGWGWYGTLETMTPGQGYKYKSNGAANQTLVYPASSGSKGIVKAAKETRYIVRGNEYRYNMNVMATVSLDGMELSDERYELSAFCGNECRGTVRLMYVEPLDRYVAFLTVMGDSDEEIFFRLYDESTGLVYLGSDPVAFEADAVMGRQRDLFPVRFASDNQVAATLNVYPNPVNRGERVWIDAADNMMKVEVVNPLGVTVRSVFLNEAGQGLAMDVAPGVYMVRCIGDNDTVKVCKVIVK